jgi:hypothetical protein
MHATIRQALALAAFTTASLAAQAGPTYMFSSATSDYYLSERADTWTGTEAAAIAFGGHLVAINDATEQAQLTAYFGSSQRLWIGLSDAANEGVFTWSNGDALNYTNWAAGEPNNWNNIEDYASMNWLGGSNAWNDLPNGGYGAGALTPIHGIIEVSRVPEPGALSLAALGLGIAALARRRRSTAAA